MCLVYSRDFLTVVISSLSFFLQIKHITKVFDEMVATLIMRQGLHFLMPIFNFPNSMLIYHSVFSNGAVLQVYAAYVQSFNRIDLAISLSPFQIQR